MFGGCFYGSRFYHLSYTCGRCVPIASNSNSKELEINEQIRDKEIRLIGADGAQMGIMSPRDALRMAIDKDLDLVKVAPHGLRHRSRHGKNAHAGKSAPHADRPACG